MKRRLNLTSGVFGGPDQYSVCSKKSKYIQWVTDFSATETVYIDLDIQQAFSDPVSEVKYGWLLESKSIIPSISQIVEDMKADPEKYFSVFKYVFTYNKDLLKLDSRFKWVPAQGVWIRQPKVYDKSKLVSMIASSKQICEGHRIRMQWIEKLRDKVDLYGHGFQSIEYKEQGLCDYMFSVAIENGQYESYFTEKILDCFATGTIPVYLGAPDIGDYFNKDGIITLSEGVELSAEMYYSKMDAIIDNLERVKKMEVLEDFIWENYLQHDIVQQSWQLR